MSPSDEPTTIVTALTDRVVLLEDVLRRLTYRDGDGDVRVGVHGDFRLDTLMTEAEYRVLDSIHPPLEHDDD